MSNATVALRFVGSPLVRRIIGEYEWSPDNGHVCEAPVELAADLLTGRESGEWELAQKPKPAVLRKLAEEMGAIPELIEVPGEAGGQELAQAKEESEVTENG